MEKEFIWDEKKYPVEPLTLKGAKEYFAVEKLLDGTDDREKQIELCIRLLGVLNCPESVIEKLPLDRFQECLTALGVVHWGKGGGDEGNAGGGEATH
jgi:hypothetical protein